MKCKTIVIGAGASGLVAAIKASSQSDVLIIEQEDRLGKKILRTGNGRCNFWNADLTLNHYHSSDKNLAIILQHKSEVLPFFESLGIIPKVLNGYYYPFSNQAKTIVEAFETKIKHLKIPVKLNEKVLKITKKKEFIVYTSKGVYQANKVIIATGSYAGLKNPQNLNSYELVSNLGHQVLKVLPSLVQLKGQDEYYKEWDGIRSEVNLEVYANNHQIAQEKGEIQLTNYGISGICVFNISDFISQGLANNQEMLIKINFCPWFKGNIPDFKNYFNQKETELNYNLKEILSGFLNIKLVNLFLKLNNISNQAYWSDVNQDKVIQTLIAFPFKVKATKDYIDAQVCIGGVPLEEINPHTLESKIVKGLYLTGEILNVAGICGGYNLGFAWMTGLIAGSN